MTATRPVRHGRCGTGRPKRSGGGPGPRTPGTPRMPTLTVQGLQLQEGGGAHLTRPLAGLRLRGGAAVRGARSCQREGKNVSPAAPPPGGPGPRRRLSSALTVPAVGAHAPLGLPVPSVARGLIRPCECSHFTGEETEHGGGGAPRRPGAGSDPSHAHAASFQSLSA